MEDVGFAIRENLMDVNGFQETKSADRIARIHRPPRRLMLNGIIHARTYIYMYVYTVVDYLEEIGRVGSDSATPTYRRFEELFIIGS